MGVFGSLNRRDRIPEKDYALGETLPPHLSPFIADRRVGDYVPPEEKKLIEGSKEGEEDVEEEESENEDEEEDEEEEDGDEESEEEESVIKKMRLQMACLWKQGRQKKIDLESLAKITD